MTCLPLCLNHSGLIEHSKKDDRTRPHVFVCFLAYAMWKTPTGWMTGAGLGDAPRMFLYEFSQIKSGDIVLPAESSGGIRNLG